MNSEPAIHVPLIAFEEDMYHHVGTVGPQDARGLEMGMWQRQPEQQQQQQLRYALGGSAELGMQFGGPISFTPHGYHTPSSGRQSDRRIL